MIQTVSDEKSHVSPELTSLIESYMAAILARLDLGYWRVYVAADKPREEAILSIEPTDGRRVAMLYVSENWDSRTPEDKRIDITHEALHLAHHDVDSHIRLFFDGSGDVSDYVKTIVIDGFTTELERMVDSLSYVLAPHMPEWVE